MRMRLEVTLQPPPISSTLTLRHVRFIGRTRPAVHGSLEAATTTGWAGTLAAGMHRSRAANGLHGHLFLINPQHPITDGSQVAKPMLASTL